MLELDKKYLHRRNKTSFNNEDIEYIKSLMEDNKSAELLILYIKVLHAKKQQDKQRESSRLSKQRYREKIKAEKKELYSNKEG